MQPRAPRPLYGYHSHAFSNNIEFYLKVKSHDFRKLHAMGTQLETWASLCCAQGWSCSDFSSHARWHQDNALTQPGPTASTWFFSQIEGFWQSISAF